MRRALLALAVLCTTSSAQASATFPAVVEKVTGATVTCTTCHHTLETGTDLTLFGAALRARGALGKDETSLEAALARMKTDAVDSDGDGARDLDELSWGGDPNTADLPPPVPEEPTYGWCSTTPGRKSGQAGLLVGLCVGLWAARRRGPDSS